VGRDEADGLRSTNTVVAGVLVDNAEKRQEEEEEKFKK
jgi:hypothetical protein